MAKNTSFAPSIFFIICAPVRMSSARSTIMRWSSVRYGSHSVPFIMTVSMGLRLGGESFTWVGKPAPPIPTMPHSAILLTSSPLAASRHEPSTGSKGTASSVPSFSICTAVTSRPDGWAKGRTDSTVPATEACTAAETFPAASPTT